MFTVATAQKIAETSVSLLGKVRNDFNDQTRLTLDLDSQVETVYGNQQLAEVGYSSETPWHNSKDVGRSESPGYRWWS